MEKNNTISILYVEDQDDVRLFLSKILSRHYSNVYLAENGKQGLELYKEHKPDIIISDIKMPVMDGLSMSTRIKEINPRARIILTTAHSDMEYFIQSIEIGINQYILKPIDREKLYNAIDICKEQVLMERELTEQSLKLKQTNDKLLAQERELRENLQKTIALKEIIARSEDNFRKVAENIQDTFWLQDEKRVVFVNKAFDKLFELPGAGMYDKPDLFKDFIYPDDRPRFLKALSQFEKSKKKEFSFQFRIITTSGLIKHIWYRDIFIPSERKGDTRRISTLTDISWKIENEQLTRELSVAEKSAELRHKLLANISHELRTPLNGIVSMSNFLWHTQLSPEQTEYLSSLRKQSHQLIDVTNKLLDISELANDKVLLTNEIIHSKQFFKDGLETHREIANKNGLGLNVVFSETFPEKFYSDPIRLQQVIDQLVTNAIKFTPEGNITIHFKSISINDSSYQLSIEVTDTGIGIENDFLETIFLAFLQANSNFNREYSGLGLGLTICEHISRLMRGKIEVKSNEGKGSTFIFSFPCSSESEKTLPVEPYQEIPELNLKVLYAEDKEVNQKIISIMLGNAGCSVDIAPNGQIALDMYEKGKYDLILMDIQMPVMDGLMATKELRRLHSNLPPIIGISANALMADAHYYMAQGLDDYLSKPVVPAVLYQKVIQWSAGKKDAKTTEPISELPPGDYQKLDDLDWSTFRTFQEQTQFDPSVINDLYGTFVNEADMLIAKIKDSIEKNDQKVLKESIHALKGLSATIGALKIYSLTFEMDHLHKKNIFTKSANLFTLLENDFSRLKSIIKNKILAQN